GHGTSATHLRRIGSVAAYGQITQRSKAMDEWSGVVTRAMVMAAGAGTRLRPLTFSVPKPMVPIANRPVLEYTLENLKRHGITEVILNLHSYPELIRSHFRDGGRWGVQIEYSHEPQLLG